MSFVLARGTIDRLWSDNPAVDLNQWQELLFVSAFMLVLGLMVAFAVLFCYLIYDVVFKDTRAWKYTLGFIVTAVILTLLF